MGNAHLTFIVDRIYDRESFRQKFIQKISELIERVGCNLGSQDSSGGRLVLTQAESIELACKEYFTYGCTIYPSSFISFQLRFGDKSLFEDESVANLIAALGPLNPSVANVIPYVVDDNEYRDWTPTNMGGTYSICLFVDAMQQAGTRLLISFPRYED